MKIGLLISALLIAILLLLMLRPWTGRPLEAPSPADAEARSRFMAACTPVASAMARPEAYCACLWLKGLKQPTETLTSPAGQAAAAQCAPSGRGSAPSSAP